MPIIAAAVIALVAHVLLMRTSYGAVLRGAGGNPKAIERAGWSLLTVKMVMFAAAGFFGMLAGLALIGLTTSADANIAVRYTLLSIAGVILGGGEFVGGRVSPVGAVIGAMTLTLAGSFLSFLRIPPDWQIGAQGAILIIVLALRVADRPHGQAAHDRGLLAKPWLWAWLAAGLVWLATGLHRRPGRRPGADRGLHLRHLLRDRRHRPDVRDHARARQCRPVDPGHDHAGRRRRHQGHGHAGLDDPRRACWWRWASACWSAASTSC